MQKLKNFLQQPPIKQALLPLFIAIGGVGIGVVVSWLIFSRSSQVQTGGSSVTSTPELKSCLKVLESSIDSYQTALTKIPQEPDKITGSHFLNAKNALDKLQKNYDTSCQNISQKEVKSLNKSVKAIATILGNFPADTNKQDSPTTEAITKIQNALNQKGKDYTIDLSTGGGGKFGPTTKTQLRKYLNASSSVLTEGFREIQVANIPVYLDEMNQKIETQNQHLWWFIIPPLAVGVLSGVALPFLFGRFLTKQYRESQQEVLKQFTALTVAPKMGDQPKDDLGSPITSPSSVPGNNQDDLLRQATKGSPGLTKPIPPLLSPATPPPPQPKPNLSSNLPPKIQELVEDYNKGLRNFRQQYDELEDVSEPDQKVKSQMKNTENNPSAFTLEIKGYNEGDYLVYEYKENFNNIHSLWLFPKKINNANLPIIQNLFTFDDKKVDYQNFQLISPAKLDAQGFQAEVGRQWEVKVIQKGEIAPKET